MLKKKISLGFGGNKLPPNWALLLSKILRYFVMFANIGWAGAAAAFDMWVASAFFICYVFAVWLLGTMVDRQIEQIRKETER